MKYRLCRYEILALRQGLRDFADIIKRGENVKTPIFDFVKSYAESDFSRLHMPGHKGKSFLGCEKYDITEIDGADVLYNASGIIKESEENASSLFGTRATFYSTEGSTLCIKAMLTLVCKGKKERPLILASRNVHKAFIYAGALLDFDVKWMYSRSSTHLCSCLLTAQEVEGYILDGAGKPDAVYITSPDYLGNLADIRGIAEVCDRYNVPLLVDNAHGAYLGFLEENLHPIHLGAAMCCDSAHKTLPVLTGGAYLHISERGAVYIPDAEEALSLHASTSPSYLTMQSLDLCNAYLSDGYRERLEATVKKLGSLKALLRELTLKVEAAEPLKLTLSPLSYGYTGNELADYLFSKGISCEFADRNFTVMMFTPENGEDDFEKLYGALSALPKKKGVTLPPLPTLTEAEARLTLREAVFAAGEWVDTSCAEGRICASPTVSCPPAVPVAVSGEVITKEAVEVFKAYGINKIKVVK